MLKHLRRYLFVLLIAVCIPQWLVAQEDVDDYRLYKFYDEEEDVLSWLAKDVDSIALHSPPTRGLYTSNAEYALQSLGFMSRGEDGFRRSYAFEGVELSSSVSRLVAQLNMRSEYSYYVDGYHNTIGRATNHIFHDASHHNEAHRVAISISGRKYLAALSHKATYRLSKRDVALKDDWYLSEYLRVNTGPDLYVDGLFSNGVDLALSLSRQWRNNSFVVAALLPWSRRSVRQATTAEAITLTGNRGYNPAWGMQSGKMRSSRINSSMLPTILTSWQRRLGMWTTMKLSAITSLERLGRTALSWCDAVTPMPDNYRFLPSYFTDDNDARPLADAWRYNDMRYTQIAWDDLYLTNTLQRDGHAAYFVENRRNNRLRAALNLDFTTKFRGVELEYGVNLRLISDRRFKVVDDLMGARHLLNIDYFIIDDVTYGTQYRNNVRDEQLQVYEGDHFGYDYRLTNFTLSAFCIARCNIRNMDFELGANVATDVLRRRGYFEKELFAANRSYGPSRSVTLLPATLFASWCYQLYGHSFDAKFCLLSGVPYPDDIFLQVDYNNRLVDNPRLSTNIVAELGYQLLLKGVTLNARLYTSYHSNECRVLHYYDDLAGEYVDAVVSDISRLNYGVELDAKLQWLRYFSSQLSLNIGRYSYCRDAQVVTYADNDNDLVAVSRSMVRGLSSAAPALSLYADVAFRRSNWHAVVSFGYVGLRHVSPSFIRRTERIASYPHTPEEQAALRDQESLPDATSLGVSLARSFRFKGGYWLSLRLSVDNVIGSANIYSGYEQHRVREVVIGHKNHVRPFDNKLTYGYGRTFRLNISFGF